MQKLAKNRWRWNLEESMGKVFVAAGLECLVERRNAGRHGSRTQARNSSLISGTGYSTAG